MSEGSFEPVFNQPNDDLLTREMRDLPKEDYSGERPGVKYNESFNPEEVSDTVVKDLMNLYQGEANVQNLEAVSKILQGYRDELVEGGMLVEAAEAATIEYLNGLIKEHLGPQGFQKFLLDQEDARKLRMKAMATDAIRTASNGDEHMYN